MNQSKFRWKRMASIALAALISSSVVQAETLTDAKYRELLELLQPGDELWRSIPWQIDLLEAQRMSAAAQKPIFIWAMDGHPLGCT